MGKVKNKIVFISPFAIFLRCELLSINQRKNEFMKILKLKDAGKEAQGLQELLQKKGYNAPQNGIFDEGTKASVIAFQQADG